MARRHSRAARLLLIERAWKWPGGGVAPPRHVVVAQPLGAHPCAIQISRGERQLVAALVRPTDGALVLGHKCATPWGAVDTLGPTYGPGTKPAP